MRRDEREARGGDIFMNGTEDPGAAASRARVPTARPAAQHSGIAAGSPPFTGLGPHTPAWPVRAIPLFLTMWGVARLPLRRCGCPTVSAGRR